WNRSTFLSKEMILAFVLVIAVVAVLLLIIPLSQPPDGESCVGSADCFTGTVTKIVDGDTLYVDNIKIRLALVDTPEHYEWGYEEAALFARNLCPPGSEATVDQDDWQLYDSYGRMLAVVYCGGKNLNEELLESGHAEILIQYCDESEFQSQKWAKDHGC
ncbi:MAG: thermonuclease family protein, partial [Thermoplasmata archaeon]|nr:thermonuclease family protein [Thermoplasmata archaeon]